MLPLGQRYPLGLFTPPLGAPPQLIQPKVPLGQFTAATTAPADAYASMPTLGLTLQADWQDRMSSIHDTQPSQVLPEFDAEPMNPESSDRTALDTVSKAAEVQGAIAQSDSRNSESDFEEPNPLPLQQEPLLSGKLAPLEALPDTPPDTQISPRRDQAASSDLPEQIAPSTNPTNPEQGMVQNIPTAETDLPQALAEPSVDSPAPTLENGPILSPDKGAIEQPPSNMEKSPRPESEVLQRSTIEQPESSSFAASDMPNTIQRKSLDSESTPEASDQIARSGSLDLDEALSLNIPQPDEIPPSPSILNRATDAVADMANSTGEIAAEPPESKQPSPLQLDNLQTSEEPILSVQVNTPAQLTNQTNQIADQLPIEPKPTDAMPQVPTEPITQVPGEPNIIAPSSEDFGQIAADNTTLKIASPELVDVEQSDSDQISQAMPSAVNDLVQEKVTDLAPPSITAPMASDELGEQVHPSTEINPLDTSAKDVESDITPQMSPTQTIRRQLASEVTTPLDQNGLPLEKLENIQNAPVDDADLSMMPEVSASNQPDRPSQVTDRQQAENDFVAAQTESVNHPVENVPKDKVPEHYISEAPATPQFSRLPSLGHTEPLVNMSDAMLEAPVATFPPQLASMPMENFIQRSLLSDYLVTPSKESSDRSQSYSAESPANPGTEFPRMPDAWHNVENLLSQTAPQKTPGPETWKEQFQMPSAPTETLVSPWAIGNAATGLEIEASQTIADLPNQVVSLTSLFSDSDAALSESIDQVEAEDAAMTSLAHIIYLLLCDQIELEKEYFHHRAIPLSKLFSRKSYLNIPMQQKKISVFRSLVSEVQCQLIKIGEY